MNIKGIFKKKVTCEYCGAPINANPADLWITCDGCAKRIPASLMKACHDEFDYVACIAGIGVLEFSDAKIKGEWVTLNRNSNHTFRDSPPYSFERGIEVRLSAILWCADAPNGS